MKGLRHVGKHTKTGLHFRTHESGGMANEKKRLISRVKRYAKKAGCAESVASLRVFNDGKRLSQLESGARIWPETIDAANLTLDKLESENG